VPALAVAVAARLVDAGLAAGEGTMARRRVEEGHDAGRQLALVTEVSLEMLRSRPRDERRSGRASRFGIIGE